MTQITVTEQGGSGRYISFGDAAALRNVFNNSNGGTVILYVKPGDQTANNYPFCKCNTNGNGLRVVANSSEQIAFSPYDSSGTALNPSCTASSSFTQNAWQHWQFTFPGNGSLLGSDILAYINDSSQGINTFNGSGSIVSDSGLTAMILNRPGLGRHFVGDLAYVAMWNRVLNSTERETVRTNGPLDVSSGLVFCFANGQDYGPNAVAVVDRTTQVAGSTPTNTNLGGTTAVSSDSATSYSVIGVVTSDAATSYSVLSEGAVESSSDTAYYVLGFVQNDSATAYQILQGITIYDTNDRGTLDLANCSVTPNGSTPTISIKNQFASEENSTGARNCFFHVTGVNGLRPVFDIDRSNMELTGYTGKFKWSYTGERGTWNDFTTTTRISSPNVYRAQHDSAFVQDTVYVSMQTPWRIGDTLPWIQSLESTGFVSYAPSGGTTYQFETRSATTDHLNTAIAAQPLYSFKISNGVSLAPDGNPKRKLVMMSGMHAAEDVGNFSLKGAVDFLTSNDQMAISVRQWFDVYVYPLVASAGRAGGAQRSDFHAAAKWHDVNRSWDDIPAMECITKHKTAVQSDAGSAIDFFLDFHGDIYTGTYYDYFSASEAKRATWQTAIQQYQPGLTVTQFSASNQSSAEWAYASKSARFSVVPEHTYSVTFNPANVEIWGANHVKAIAYLIAQGEWGLPIVQSDSAAAYTVLSAVSRDSAATYDILSENSVASSSSTAYYVLTSAAQNSSTAYFILGATTLTQADLVAIASAILSAAQVTPIYSDVRKVNNYAVDGSGQPGDEWGPA